MSLRIGLLCEGRIDEELIQPLLQKLIGNQVKIFFSFPVPPNGFGEIPKNLRMLIKLKEQPSEWERIWCHVFIIILDSKRTESIQKEIKKILDRTSDFPAVYGLAIQEIEAWVLGDIENVNRHVLNINPCPRLLYSPETDPDPKATLNSIFITQSSNIESDCWNVECARLVAPFLRVDQLKIRCPKGFGKLAKKILNKNLN
jgi:hypothetical protein